MIIYKYSFGLYYTERNGKYLFNYNESPYNVSSLYFVIELLLKKIVLHFADAIFDQTI